MLRACHRERVPFVARGAGTGLSGGATPIAGGVVVSLARMNRILEIDLASQRIVVEPGVANLDVTRAVAADGFFYAPDPSSQQVCTIGGNVAENSGGAHCLKYGFTAHHVTGLTFVLPDGEVVELGGKALDPDGPDLLGVIVGSEGTLGIATRITLRLVRTPQAVRTLLAGVPHDGRGRRSRLRDRRGGRHAVGDRDDGPAHDRGGRARRRARLPGRRRRRAPRRARRRRRAGRGRRRGVRAHLRSSAARSRSASRRATPTARSSGRAASRRSRPWAASRPTTTCRTASSRARGSPRCCARIEELSARARPARRQRLPRGRRQPAPARPLRLGGRRDGAGARARRGDPRRLPRRRRLAHRRARRRHGQGVLDAADVLGARPAGVRAAAPRVRPGRASAIRAR